MRLFPKIATAILCFFLGLMLYVAIIAHTRTSGNTGMDMGQVQRIRYEAQQKTQIPKP